MTENIIKIIYNGSGSIIHYVIVNNTNVCYGRTSIRVDTTIMQLRLGYEYCWQHINSEDDISCILYEENSYDLQHYIHARKLKTSGTLTSKHGIAS